MRTNYHLSCPRKVFKIKTEIGLHTLPPQFWRPFLSDLHGINNGVVVGRSRTPIIPAYVHVNSRTRSSGYRSILVYGGSRITDLLNHPYTTNFISISTVVVKLRLTYNDLSLS